MKKLLLTLVVMGGGSLLAYNHRITFNESARKGGTFRITANVVARGPAIKEVTPSDKPFDFGTFAINCVDRFEVKVAGGEYDGTYLKASLPLWTRCTNHSITLAKAGELVEKTGAPLFTSADGKLALQIKPA